MEDEVWLIYSEVDRGTNFSKKKKDRVTIVSL